MSEEKRKWLESFRIFTPILVTASIFLLTGINAKVDKLDSMIFQHFTNDEIHVPRSQITQIGDFSMYVKMRDAQWNKLYDSMFEFGKKQDEMMKIILDKKNETN